MPEDHNQLPELRQNGSAVPAEPVAVARPTVLPHDAYSEWSEGFSDQNDQKEDGLVFSPAELYKQKWLILAVAILLAAAAIPPIWMFVVPTFRSRAVIEVSPVVSRIVYKTDQNGTIPFYDSFLNTQVSTIQSPKILQRVLDRKSVQQTAWYTAGSANRPALERLMESLSVRPRPRTHLIDVSLSAENAKDAKLIVDSVVDEYIRYVTEISREDQTRLLETLRSQRDARRQRIVDLVQRQQDLARDINTMDSDALRSQLSVNLSELESEQADLLRELNLMKWKQKRLTRKRSQSESNQPTTQPGTATPELSQEVVYSMDPEWRRLSEGLQKAKLDLELEQTRYGDAHPRIQQMKSGVEFAESQLAARQQQIDSLPHGMQAPRTTEDGQMVAAGMPLANPLEVISETIDERSQELELIEKDLVRRKQKADEVGEVAKRIAELDAQIRQEREVYEDVRRRLEALEIESRAAAEIGVHSYGLLPSKASQDRRLLFTAMATGCAMMSGLVVGFLRSRTDPKIRDAGSVRRITPVPFLGQIPLAANSQQLLLSADSMDDSVDKPFEMDISTHLIRENMRMVRTALMSRFRDRETKTILVTSSVAGSGKSTFTILLAQSLAALGKKVLVVEADFRRPSLGGRLGIENTQGLIDLLAGAAEYDQAVFSAAGGCFHLVPAGKRLAEHDPELLANGAFSACLTRWREQYDFILIDSPPVLAVADARIMAHHADGTILVVRASHDARSEAIEAAGHLKDSGPELLGTVLIGGDQPRKSKYGYGYGYGYGQPYHAQSEVSAIH